MRAHQERHRSGRGPWLRAAVLGADDAVVSTASLMIGVAATSASQASILVAGIAGLVRGLDVDGGRRVRLGELAGRRGAGGLAETTVATARLSFLAALTASATRATSSSR